MKAPIAKQIDVDDPDLQAASSRLAMQARRSALNLSPDAELPPTRIERNPDISALSPLFTASDRSNKSVDLESGSSKMNRSSSSVVHAAPSSRTPRPEVALSSLESPSASKPVVRHSFEQPSGANPSVANPSVAKPFVQSFKEADSTISPPLPAEPMSMANAKTAHNRLSPPNDPFQSISVPHKETAIPLKANATEGFKPISKPESRSEEVNTSSFSPVSKPATRLTPMAKVPATSFQPLKPIADLPVESNTEPSTEPASQPRFYPSTTRVENGLRPAPENPVSTASALSEVVSSEVAASEPASKKPPTEFVPTGFSDPISETSVPAVKPAVNPFVANTNFTEDANSLAQTSVNTIALPEPVRPEPAQPIEASPLRSGNVLTAENVLVELEGRSVHHVQQGESLWSIAQQHYGDGEWFRALYQYNKHELAKPDELAQGDSITLPLKQDLRQLWPELCPVERTRVGATADTNAVAYGQSDSGFGHEPDVYETRAGDTLFEIARQRLGQASRYVELLELNGNRLHGELNHLTPLRAGIRLVMPAQ